MRTDGRTEGRNKGKKENKMEKRKKTGKKTTTQDVQSHTENACKEQHKNLGSGGERIRL